MFLILRRLAFVAIFAAVGCDSGPGSDANPKLAPGVQPDPKIVPAESQAQITSDASAVNDTGKSKGKQK